MVRAKLSAEQVIADHQRRAVEKQVKLQQKLVQQALAAHPTALPHVVSTLQGLGILDERGLSVMDQPSTASFPRSSQAAALSHVRGQKKKKAREGWKRVCQVGAGDFGSPKMRKNTQKRAEMRKHAQTSPKSHEHARKQVNPNEITPNTQETTLEP